MSVAASCANFFFGDVCELDTNRTVAHLRREYLCTAESHESRASIWEDSQAKQPEPLWIPQKTPNAGVNVHLSFLDIPKRL